MSKTHLIMPMGGAGSRFYKNGYMMPKPLIEIEGKPFLYWAAMSIAKYVDLADITFVVLQQHIDEHQIDRAIKNLFPEAKIEVLPEILPGPVFTSLHGVEHIADDGPIIFNDCDHMFKCDELNKALNAGDLGADGTLVTFLAHEPQFSYIKFDENKNIIGTIEKQVASDHAICGAYAFRSAALFKDLASEYVKNCPYNECFMSGLYNVMCERNLTINDYLLDYHVEFGTPEEYKKAEGSVYFEDLK